MEMSHPIWGIAGTRLATGEIHYSSPVPMNVTRKQVLQQGLQVGNSASKHCNKLSNSVGIGFGGGVSTDGAGSNRLSNVSNWSGTTGGTVTAATIRSSSPHPGSSTVYTGKVLFGPGLTILRALVSAWLSHTRQRSTISRMGVSGGTLSRCRHNCHGQQQIGHVQCGVVQCDHVPEGFNS